MSNGYSGPGLSAFHAERKLPLMPLREVVIFPHSIMPLFVGRGSSIKAVDTAVAEHDKKILLVAQRSPDQEKPDPKELFEIGTVARILQVLRLPDGTVKVLFEGLYRTRWQAEELVEGKSAPAAEGNAAVTPGNSAQIIPGRAEEHPTAKITVHITRPSGQGGQGAQGSWQPKIEVTAESEPGPGGPSDHGGSDDAPNDKRSGDSTNGQDDSFYLAKVMPVAENEQSGSAAIEGIHAVLEVIEEYNKANKKIPPETMVTMQNITVPGRLADIAMSYIKLDYRRKQEVLEILDPLQRLNSVHDILQGEIAVSAVERNIKSRVKHQMERNQREYYLNEQIKAIHKEMGRDDDPQAELVDLEKRMAEKDMPVEARERGVSELKKLRYMSPSAAEYTVVRNYVDWILDLPWNTMKETSIDIRKAKEILDRDHYGLEKPKERILEYLAVQKLSNKLKGPILCLVGPPGVGKTSLARSVASATQREFVRLSLGGVRDEAEIRGHRRTYVGALPGKIIQSLKRVKSSNPLFCLDEVDKMSSDFRGDPASALLEVLDPEQNSTFSDHYLDLDYDLSKVFFITTANSLHSIPAPLQDRMEIIRLPGYLETEKTQIAKGFLLPKQIEANGLKPENLQLSDNAITEIIRSYTREAGVRNLEREIATVCRKSAMQLVEKDDMEAVIKVGAQSLGKLLGVKKFRYGEREGEHQIGVCTGLAYTDFGGDILMVETALMPGTGKLNITGKLGEVMTESAKAALSYVRSRSTVLGLRPDFNKDIDIHIHVPEGATPKDGPSAGITLATSLVSALLGLPIRNDIAMTGEITLRGRVLPIGGLREKLLAAHRGLIKTVLIPKDNAKDLKEVPEAILRGLEVRLVDNVDQVLPQAIMDAGDILFKQGDEPMQFFQKLRSAGHDISGATQAQ